MHVFWRGRVVPAHADLIHLYFLHFYIFRAAYSSPFVRKRSINETSPISTYFFPCPCRQKMKNKKTKTKHWHGSRLNNNNVVCHFVLTWHNSIIFSIVHCNIKRTTWIGSEHRGLIIKQYFCFVLFWRWIFSIELDISFVSMAKWLLFKTNKRFHAKCVRQCWRHGSSVLNSQWHRLRRFVIRRWFVA